MISRIECISGGVGDKYGKIISVLKYRTGAETKDAAVELGNRAILKQYVL